MKFFSHGVLGMNARNLKYIRTKNTGESVSLADSKLKTKNFLSARGIPFAETYAVIDSGQKLHNFSFDSIPENSFVIKPNHGSKGQGILIVKRNKNNFSIAGQNWNEDQVRLHMMDTLGGAFSLYGNHDSVVIEELLMPGKDFSKYCRHGLADIRMIVCNYVPITAMVRMPTELSGGKANLAQGGIGLGLNIATGEVMSFYQHKKNHTEVFPSGYEYLKGSKIPFWDDILLYSSQIQFYTGLGYLALDWVITKNGPKLLEINARAGLEIQNVNLVPLARRLQQVNNLKIKTPEKGVEIAKTLFNTDVATTVGNKKVIYSLQKVPFRGKNLTVRVDIFAEKTQFSADIKKKFTKETTLLFPGNVSFSLFPTEEILDSEERNTIVLGQDNLQNCLIIPGLSPDFEHNKSSKFADNIVEIDEKMYQISKRVGRGFFSRPLNYSVELDKFLKNPHHYNPTFEYNFPSDEKIQETKNLLDEIEVEIQNLDAKDAIFQKLFSEKLVEYKNSLDLIIAYKNENHTQIAEINKKLFGEFREDLIEISTKKVLERAKIDTAKQEKLLGPLLSYDQIIEGVQNYLKENNFPEIEIILSNKTLSRMAVAYKKNGVHINIASNVSYRKQELDAVLVHELGTHLRRYLEGKKLGLKIFMYGTADYLTEEEGLAVYNSFLHLPEGYEKNAMYINYYVLSQIDTLSFVQTAQLLHSIYVNDSLERIFQRTFRLKRGLKNTGISGREGTTYQKDKIYLEGYARISRWIEDGGDVNLLYSGKVKISDLPLIAKL